MNPVTPPGSAEEQAEVERVAHDLAARILTDLELARFKLTPEDEWLRAKALVVELAKAALTTHAREARRLALEEAATMAQTPVAGEQDDITMQAKDRIATVLRARAQASAGAKEGPSPTILLTL